MSHILPALCIPLLLSSAAAVLLVARAAPMRRAVVPSRSGASHRVVVIGAGFGGLQTARRLVGVPGVALTVLDQHNYHLFQPLLYQVATAALSPDDIASPIRAVLADQGTTEVLMEEVTGIDAGAHQV